MIVNIKDKEIELKFTIRSMMMYENITGESFSDINNITSIMFYFYATILASSKDYTITYEDFEDYIDANPQAFMEFTHWIASTSTVNDILKKN